MQIEYVAGALDDFSSDLKSDPLRYGALGFAGISPIEILAVHRAVINRPAQKRRHVRRVHCDHSAGDLLRIELRQQALQGDDRRILVAVIAGNQRQHRPRLRAMHDRYRNDRALVVEGGHLHQA